mgnify:CR=1 FL=1
MSELKKLPEEEFESKKAQEKVELMLGQFHNFEGMCVQGIYHVMRQSHSSYDNKTEGFTQIVEAFKARVEEIFASGTHASGSHLDHLNGSLLSEAEYHLLNAEAAQIAGMLFEKLEFPKHAKKAHAQASKSLARARRKYAELARHVNL